VTLILCGGRKPPQRIASERSQDGGVSAPPTGVTSPEGMRSPEEALFPREDTYFQDRRGVVDMTRVAVLGSTGSIGTQTLDVIERLGEEYRVVGLAAGGNWRKLRDQVKRYEPEFVAMAEKPAAAELQAVIGREVLAGTGGIERLVEICNADVYVVAVVGAAGIRPTLAALKQGRRVALANKEALVAAGELVMATASRERAEIIPVDSEHSAIFQCLEGVATPDVASVILTASGGPFRDWSLADMEHITVDQALNHPNWDMGGKITVDSATLMNKGLEVIEAHWLFGLAYDRIRIVIHPESIVHSLVEMIDGAVLAQLGTPDMRIPIQFALTYPERRETGLPSLSLIDAGPLRFHHPDLNRFPCLRLALQAARAGGTMPAVLSAANEVSAMSFIAGEIGFLDIATTVEEVLGRHESVTDPCLDDIMGADTWARAQARQYIRYLRRSRLTSTSK